ncbi:hypothetical protein F2P56_026683 [Juglans regia]|uniref:Elicitor-responsive protein 3 n=2 Tax=Juglans regia TaxID=51240 RepID=A0A2I4HSM4_JUGRE|nr:elicitor-responsive protein 3 [Juglans regia]KAF5451590.1 hypothetical protein F2P56_026683 [Juglans regia]
MRSHALVLFLFTLHKTHTHTQMRGGILEVLLVNAEGIRHTKLIGTQSYYVVIECGTQVHRSKVSSGEDDKAWWNEKFLFELPMSDWKNLTHLKIRIMDTEFLTDSAFIGETMIYLGGIVLEGAERDFIEIKPAPYNVVLEDDTYEGQIKIGIKFIANVRINGNRLKSHPNSCR